MTDTPILDASVANAPKSYVVAGAQEIILKGVTASFNGSGAAGSYVPAVQIIDPAGNVIGTYTLGSTLAAGASADVSWFPGVGNGGTGSTTTARTIELIIDGGGLVIATGVKADIELGYAATITKWTLLADQSGSIVVNIWKDTFANYPPTVADKITAAAPPTITTATKGQSSTLTGWTTAITAGDTLRFNVDSVTSIQRVTLALEITA